MTWANIKDPGGGLPILTAEPAAVALPPGGGGRLRDCASMPWRSLSLGAERKGGEGGVPLRERRLLVGTGM